MPRTTRRRRSTLDTADTGSVSIEGISSHAADLQMVLRLANGQRFGEQITLPAPGGRKELADELTLVVLGGLALLEGVVTQLLVGHALV